MDRSALSLAVLGAGVLLALYGGVAVASGRPGLQALALGLVVCVGVLFERSRYKRLETSVPPGGFEPTGERFVDPATKSPVTVYVHPRTGERKYVRDQ